MPPLMRATAGSPSSISLAAFHCEPDRCLIAVTKRRHQPNHLVRLLIAMPGKCGDPIPVEIKRAADIFRRGAPIDFGDHAGLRDHSRKSSGMPGGGSTFLTTTIWRAGGGAATQLPREKRLLKMLAELMTLRIRLGRLTAYSNRSVPARSSIAT
jgi:hypothetical protein